MESGEKTIYFRSKCLEGLLSTRTNPEEVQSKYLEQNNINKESGLNDETNIHFISSVKKFLH